MIPAEDWMTDLESRIASLKRGLGIDSRPDPVILRSVAAQPS